MKNACCACRQEGVEIFELRKGVRKCAKCTIESVGRSIMGLFRKALKHLPAPVHVLVAVSGGCSSVAVWDLLSKRLNTALNGKSAVVKKLQAITSKKDDFNIPGIVHIDEYTVPNVVRYAKENDFNCVVLGDNAEHVALASLGAISVGRPDLSSWITNDDEKNFAPLIVIRPARQCLEAELKFYCKENGLNIDDEKSDLQKAFVFEQKMLDNVKVDGHGEAPFAIQKMGEKLPRIYYEFKCPKCGLPSSSNEKCQMCVEIEKHQNKN